MDAERERISKRLEDWAALHDRVKMPSQYGIDRARMDRDAAAALRDADAEITTLRSALGRLLTISEAQSNLCTAYRLGKSPKDGALAALSGQENAWEAARAALQSPAKKEPTR